MLLFASILASPTSNYYHFAQQIRCDGFHIDIMADSVGVGLPIHVIEQLQSLSKPIQVHLMGGANLLQEILPYDPDIIFVHPKWCDPTWVKGSRVGVVWDDDDSAQYFAYADEILFMTVQPGACGQEMLRNRLDTIRAIMPNKPCWVDGGVNQNTLPLLEGLNLRGIIAGNGLVSLGATHSR